MADRFASRRYLLEKNVVNYWFLIFYIIVTWYHITESIPLANSRLIKPLVFNPFSREEERGPWEREYIHSITDTVKVETYMFGKYD